MVDAATLGPAHLAASLRQRGREGGAKHTCIAISSWLRPERAGLYASGRADGLGFAVHAGRRMDRGPQRPPPCVH
eukprot:838834-Prymnesium_polylepis.1